MPVPEAPMNEDHFLALGEDEVGFSRHVLLMQSVSIAKFVDDRTHNHLRLGVLALYQAHPYASFFWRKTIGHTTNPLYIEP